MSQTPLEIQRGVRFSRVIQWMTDPLVTKRILNVVASNPFRFDAPAHGLPPDWLASVPGLMRECGSGTDPDWHRVTVLDADTFEFQDIGENQGARFLLPPDTLIYKTPVGLAGCTAVMPIYTSEDQSSPVLHTLSTGNGEIVMDDADSRILLDIADTDFDWTEGFFNLDVTLPGRVAQRLLSGWITVKA